MTKTTTLPLAALVAGALVAGIAALAPATPALACGPDDCRGMSAEDLARDRAEIRRLNREQLRYVQRRDAEYARGWEATRQHQQDLRDYAADRAEYERRMAAWRDAVRRCRAGDYRYCEG